MNLAQILIVSALVSLGYFTVLWLISLWKRDSSIVDIFWGSAFVLLAAVYYILAGGYPGRKLLVILLVTVWGLRLSVRILRRNWGRPEDYRYRAWREAAGEKYWWFSFIQVFLVQGGLAFLISGPLLAAQFSAEPGRLTLFDLFGGLVWGLGFFFEAVGDWQLDRFNADPANKGKVMRSGLWAYTRHPNYFGDAMIWWGLFVIALGVPGGFWMIYSPILMTWLLVRVSGVALLEKTIVERRPGYREYTESTSAFVPWFPKRAIREAHKGS